MTKVLSGSRPTDEIDWEELDNAIDDQFHDPAFKNLGIGGLPIPGEGDNPKAFILGAAPGAQEVIQGRPFVGPAGIVLHQLMAVAGLYTTDYQDDVRKTYGVGNCWLTNTVKFRTPGNRKPTGDEVRAARPYLQREWIAVGKPRVIVLVGEVALYAITGQQQSILRAAGKMHYTKSNIDGQPLYVWPMVHPSFGLRHPTAQPLLEQDWQKLGEWIAKNT